MDFKFIEECKKNAQNGWNIQESAAYESIIQFLFRLKLYGKEKARQIDEYDGESMFRNTTLYPGHIYAFIYQSDTPSTFNDGRIKFVYSDTLPIVLVTHIEAGKVRGINLNLCSYGLRAYIINALHNLDLQFYERGNLEMVNNKRMPISNNVAKIFLNQDTEKAFFEHIKNACKLEHTEILYRTYAVRNIKYIRMIEIWQHKYIPFLTYNGEMKKDILELIHKVTGTDKVHI